MQLWNSIKIEILLTFSEKKIERNLTWKGKNLICTNSLEKRFLYIMFERVGVQPMFLRIAKFIDYLHSQTFSRNLRLGSANAAFMECCFPETAQKYKDHCMKRVQIKNFFWSVFSCIRIRRNSLFGHFSRSGYIYIRLFIY